MLGSVVRSAHRLMVATDETRNEAVAEETAIALVYNGISHAVMMATPKNLEDLGVGFSLTERIVEQHREIYDVEVEGMGNGIEVRLSISAKRMAILQQRRRSLVGRTGCGLCGVDSINAALRSVTPIKTAASIAQAAIHHAMASLPGQQQMNMANGAMHAAGWATIEGDLILVREDVGRHNALDKLAGALSRGDHCTEDGFIVVTSRCSYEMVQKAAALNAALIASVSAPTSLAIETAEQAGIALASFVRDDRMTAYAFAGRIAR